MMRAVRKPCAIPLFRERHEPCRASKTVDSLHTIRRFGRSVVEGPNEYLFFKRGQGMKKLFKTIRRAIIGIAPVAVMLLLSTALFAQGPIFTVYPSNLSNIIR